MLWGIDLGGTKIEAAVLDGAEVVRRRRIPTEAARGYEHVLRQVRLLIEQVCEEAHLPWPERIGTGTPGSRDPGSGLMRNSNTQCLNGRDLQSDLEKTLGCPVRLANDANCFALAEATLGAAADRRVVFGVILGTGVGGGVVVDGKVIDGKNGIAGEWGHTPVHGFDEPCWCGQNGCLESIASGPALERWHQQQSGQALPFHAIAASESPEATQTVSRLISALAPAVAAVINLLDPDCIVLGGGVGQTPGLAERLHQAALPLVFHEQATTEFLMPALGDSAGVFGAAMLSSWN